ncbi:MAG: single-stranded-DNA-specific exonuclease RecJ [Candidatus Moranbacteria bacterium]|nr:single-stranded-DNA-specific exonuclease RecJ [Candidatus Moranbacteria bacterium]OIQ02004.1 MAG: single-stranded-DNA-specific exonuclease RecJ [Candidatus Moranbacteria bacterium CG2_30_41_165]PIP25956.1 MAG: single-stranded-DNA-specific exonuclease RecJ [Candidatus Moranbacteria bacterium CG23_combo_of_CG06-09_8_20_14_all_41_28]PIV86373.1 MAG: single-stranded-DNA-specific exonuclease RecJ [Candidatus Moranbacteria bacterium CG17_big_fil_post_rev_8_21_14_2_50_41_107]PIW94372.1 MAG: single-s
MAVWKYRVEDIQEKSTSGKYHPVIETLLETRGYDDEESRQRFLFPSFDRDIYDPFLFSQMERVVSRIGETKKNKETIGVFGDFDADGVTSSVIIREALTALHIPVEVYIPEKMNEGHGFNILAVDFFESKGIKLILTLDCGMTNHEAISEAKKRGIETIVVDHHHVPEILPEAYAIINPKIATETYPFRELCGAGTSFKVAQALFLRYIPEEQDQLKWILDVVAIGTVADVMPLIGENRAIVKYGLIVLSKTRRVGLEEMFSVGRIKIDEDTIPDAHTIGFQIAPRINAASRMAHAMLAHNLLIEKDRARARVLALELDAYNVARQKISATTTNEVRAIAVEKYSERKFIFALDEKFPFGIIGLVAGRIANEFHKPTCVLTRGETESRGSFRSIPELNVIEIIEQCGDLLKKFGGHAQAAGMTIENKNIDAFYEKFDALATEVLADVITQPEIWVDMKLHPEHITQSLVRDLTLFAPFGEGNPEPVFALENMLIEEVRFVGNGEKHMKFRLAQKEGGTKVFDAIGFSLGKQFPDLKQGNVIDVLFQLSENTWNGKTTIQLKLLDIRPKISV